MTDDRIISPLIYLAALLVAGLWLRLQKLKKRRTRMTKDDLQAIEESMKELKILKNRKNPRAQGKTYNLILHVDFGKALFLIPSIGIEEEADKNMTYEELFSKLGKRIDQAVNDPATYKTQQLSELNSIKTEY